MEHVTFAFNSSNGIVMTDVTEENQLLFLDKELRRLYLPDIVAHALFLTFGVLENSCVLFMYMFKVSSRREDRFFIMVLASIDLCHCIFSSALVLTKDFNPLTFPEKGACKLLLFFSNVFFILTLFILIVICVCRYIHICLPLRRRVSRRENYLAIGIVTAVSLILALPKLIYFRHVDIVIEKAGGLVGHVCSVDPDLYGALTVVPMFTYICIALSLLGALLMAVLYSLIGKIIYKQIRQFRSMRSEKLRLRQLYAKSIAGDIDATRELYELTNTTDFHGVLANIEDNAIDDVNENRTSVYSNSLTSNECWENISNLNNQGKSNDNDIIIKESQGKQIPYSVAQFENDSNYISDIKFKDKVVKHKDCETPFSTATLRGKHTRKRKAKTKSLAVFLKTNKRAQHSTIMFIIITIITAVSFTSTWTYVLYDSADPGRWTKIPVSETRFFIFLRSLHALGYLSRPLIYMFYDNTLYREMAKMCFKNYRTRSGSII